MNLNVANAIVPSDNTRIHTHHITATHAHIHAVTTTYIYTTTTSLTFNESESSKCDRAIRQHRHTHVIIILSGIASQVSEKQFYKINNRRHKYIIYYILYIIFIYIFGMGKSKERERKPNQIAACAYVCASAYMNECVCVCVCVFALRVPWTRVIIFVLIAARCLAAIGWVMCVYVRMCHMCVLLAMMRIFVRNLWPA